MLPCKIFGHRWVYKDYRHACDEFGGKLNYNLSRRCVKCLRREVHLQEGNWIEQKAEVVA